MIMSSPIRRSSILCIPETISLKSIERNRVTCLRLNASSWPVSSAARVAAFSTCSSISPPSGSFSSRRRSSTAYPVMIVNRLLKSCAIPPASLPTASIFCERRSFSSYCRSSVMSLAI